MAEPSPPASARAGWGRRLLALLAFAIARLLLATLRLRVLHPERLARAREEGEGGQPLLYAFWHGRQLGLFRANPEKHLAVMASLSRDGALQAVVCRRFGLTVVRGSSSRGGLQALRGLAERLRAGVSVGLAVDGPRGPAEEAKPGILALASRLHCPVVPITIGYSRCGVLRRAWDRFRIPAPFARAVVVYGEPMRVPRTASREELVRLAGELTARLRSITAEADLAASQ
ncbi:MAG: lysophospholipid acyltransferase family protein [Myxococcales bacterium]|nr:lysophospholipid acyltransferase family protein [Myxococcales bacterium]